MQLHELKTIHKSKDRKRVGRGGKRGTYSGKGLKGQKARAGRKLKPSIRGLIKKYPKLRGYKFNVKIKNPKTVVLNLKTLDKKISADQKITPKILLEKGIITKIKGRVPNVKILGKGEITRVLVFDGFQVSKSAKDKIEKAGGKII